MTLDEILQGNIPETLDGKTATASQLVTISRRIVPVTSLLIASARRDNFRDDVPAWAVWCRDVLGMDGSDRDHRRAIGELLLDTRDNAMVYDTLFNLSFNKLIPLTRIDAEQIEAFLSHYDVARMDRDEVGSLSRHGLTRSLKSNRRLRTCRDSPSRWTRSTQWSPRQFVRAYQIRRRQCLHCVPGWDCSALRSSITSARKKIFFSSKTSRLHSLTKSRSWRR